LRIDRNEIEKESKFDMKTIIIKEDETPMSVVNAMVRDL